VRKGFCLPQGRVQTAAGRRVGSTEDKNGSFIRGGWGGVGMWAERRIQQTMEEARACRHTEG